MSEQFSARDRRGQLDTFLQNRNAADAPARFSNMEETATVPVARRTFGTKNTISDNKNKDHVSFGYNKSNAVRLLALYGFLTFIWLLSLWHSRALNHPHFINILIAALFLLCSLKSLYRLLEDDPIFFLSSHGIKIRGYADEWIPWAEVTVLQRTSRHLTFQLIPKFRPAREKQFSLLGKFAISKRDKVKIILARVDCDPEQIVEQCGRYAAGAGTRPLIQDPAKAIGKNEPCLTYILIALLFVIYAAEMRFAVEPSKAGTIGLKSLAFSGASNGLLVFRHSDWWRLFTAPLLHMSVAHLTGNCIVLFFGGRWLERLIGWRWAGAIFVVSALAGSVGSLLLHQPNILTTGASGAIMGLLAALLIIGFRFPTGSGRVRPQLIAAQFLIPALAPALAAHTAGPKIDYAAHGFGAAAGALIAGLLFTQLWPRNTPQPRFGAAAALLTMAFFLIAGGSLIPIVQERRAYARFLQRKASEMTSDAKSPATPKFQTPAVQHN